MLKEPQDRENLLEEAGRVYLGRTLRVFDQEGIDCKVG